MMKEREIVVLITDYRYYPHYCFTIITITIIITITAVIAIAITTVIII